MKHYEIIRRIYTEIQMDFEKQICSILEVEYSDFRIYFGHPIYCPIREKLFNFSKKQKKKLELCLNKYILETI